MRVIAEASIHRSEKDENGMFHIKDRYCPEEGTCCLFDGNGKPGKRCRRFDQLPTGVKICEAS